MDLVERGDATGRRHPWEVAVRALEVAKQRLAPARAGPAGVGHWEHGPALTAAVTSVLGAEAKVSMALGTRGRGLPGLSYWVVGRRRR